MPARKPERLRVRDEVQCLACGDVTFPKNLLEVVPGVSIVRALPREVSFPEFFQSLGFIRH